jgi:hypothetical protein
MDIETTSYLSARQRSNDPAMDRALKAEAIAADAVRLMVASMSISDGILALVEHRYAQLQAAERRYQEERSAKRPVGASGESKRKRK